jgi:hypothetical protein
MKRDLVLLLLGAWLLGLVAMAAVAMQNFYTIDRMLDSLPNSTFARGVEALDEHEAPAARDFLRYLSSELNRLFFWGWGLAEVVIGAAVTWLAWSFPERRVRWVAVAMLATTLVLTFGATPPIVSIGRELDFVPRDPPPPELATFGLLHAAYSIGDGIKLVLGSMMAFWIVRGGRTRQARRDYS